MSNALFQNGKATLEFARRTTESLLANIPEDKRLHQVCPGANHAYWFVGHIGCTDDYFLTTMAGKGSGKLEAYNPLFGMQSSPKTAESDYPPFAELHAYFQECRAALLGWFESLSDAELVESLSKEMQMFARTKAELMNSLAWHEGMHAGQLTVLRRGLGLKPLIG